jgi:hexosaminidase
MLDSSRKDEAMTRYAPFRCLATVASTLLLTTALTCATAQAATDTVRPALIPAPALLVPAEGRFDLKDDTFVHASGPQALAVARQFVDLVAKSGRGKLKIVEHAHGNAPGIVFAIEQARAPASPEAYVLDVGPQGLRVSANDQRGLFYGAVTLWQLMSADSGKSIRLPALRIDDTPRFVWRGLMLDSARHFWSVDEIKQLLDAMSLHKLNTFHWHLTDDQGWRIEIRKHPKLTQVGGCRIPAGDGGIDPRSGEPRPYCGHYTQAQIRDVVRYAAERHIEVVPEIDVPGHAQAAVAAYPQLGNVDGPTRVSADWGVHTYLFNAEEDTFRFLEDVLAEVVELFPGRYVHIGGDEAVKQQWQQSSRVQARMRALGVANETELQGYLVKRLETFLQARGKRLIGWDEILEDELPSEAVVMSWRGIEGGIEAANKGHDVVMSPSSDLYLDYLQTDSPDEPPGRPATITLRKVYDFEPVPAALDAARRRHILGLQANVWTEHMRSFARVEHAIFPRIAAVAETGWSPAARKDYADFVARLPAQLGRYRALGIAYAQTPFAVRMDATPSNSGDNVEVALSNSLELGELRYTTDGSAPVAGSARYREPLKLQMPVELRATAFFDGQPLADATTRRFDAASRLQRQDEALAMCSQGLMLRLEDDGPLTGPRAIYNVDIFNPCWLWRDAPLAGVAGVEVRAGRIPYYFQLWKDEANRKFRPVRTAHGELEIRAGCEGDLLASVPLPAAPAKDGFIDLEAKLPAQSASGDLCFVFTGDTRPSMWAIDAVRLLPKPN